MRLLFSLLTHFSALSSSSFRECEDEQQRHNKGDTKYKNFCRWICHYPRNPPHTLLELFILSSFHNFFLFPSIYLSIYIHSHLAFYPLQLITSPTDSKGHLFHVCVRFIYSRIFSSIAFCIIVMLFFCCFYFYIFSKDSKLPFSHSHSSHLMMIQADVCMYNSIWT